MQQQKPNPTDANVPQHTNEIVSGEKKSDERSKLAFPEEKSYENVNFVDTSKPVWNYSLLTDEDVKNYQAGTNYSLYEKFGSHSIRVNDIWGMYFCVWAPNATSVSVTGNFNHWKNHEHELYPRWDKSGIWEGFIPGFNLGEAYKYYIVGFGNKAQDKGDPFANFWEKRPLTASITWDMYYEWTDAGWMNKRKENNSLDSPWSVYEVHLASWMRPDKGDEETYNTYDQIRERLVPYVKEMGFTHVELMPVMEHPFDGSWGYQCTGFFASTSRFGDPQGLMRLIDAFHNEDIGVILDWVPSHFPYDAHGLFMFDGTHTYEYADMRKGFHPDWNSYIFNYKRGEVKSFLISSAKFWFDKFHIDGIRVDAVSSMLKLNYSRTHGQWNQTNLVVKETWKQWLLSKTLMRPFTGIFLMCKPLPKKQQTGREFQGQRGKAD